MDELKQEIAAKSDYVAKVKSDTEKYKNILPKLAQQIERAKPKTIDDCKMWVVIYHPKLLLHLVSWTSFLGGNGEKKSN